ncbi:MAG: CPBP family intramembrane metalloprotease, partial [Desulfobacteraceae bacterium]|nr:CPBP family intramembrane metalloprotease [Desulfobacteraceae bacterium]
MKKNKIKIFFFTLFSLCAAIFLLAYFIDVTIILLAPVYMFTPFVATIVTNFIYNEKLENYGLSLKLNQWFLFAWLFPVFFALTTLGIGLIFPGIEFSSTMQGLLNYGVSPDVINDQLAKFSFLTLHPIFGMIIYALVAGITINTLFAFGEEFGWRGFLQKELSHLNFWKSSFIIGFIWGIWHLPLIIQGHNYPKHPYIGVGMMIIFTILLSPLFAYTTIKTDSVVATSIMHGTINAVAGIVIA